MTTLPHSAIILAGGLGTRLRNAVPDLPKPMAPVNGRPFLELLMDYWIGQGIDRFILSVGYRHEFISRHFGQTYKTATIDYAIETTPMGTGGGLLLAMDKLPDDSPFLLLNGDTYFSVDLAAFSAFFHEHQADWLFSLFDTDNTQRYMGLDVLKNGRIRALKKQAAAGETARANGGVYMVNPKALNDVNRAACSLENDLFPAALAAKQSLFGLAFSGTFIDIGVPEDYRRAGTIIG